MKAKIRSLDPTGVEVEAEEFELPVVVDIVSREGVCEVTQPDGIIITYEPMRQFRYFLEIGKYVYRINAMTGELSFICKNK